MFRVGILPFTTGPLPDRGRARLATRPKPAVEALEGRALLSHVHAHLARPRAADVLPPSPPVPPNAHPGPILNQIGIGHAIKSPRLYPYTTSTRAELNGAGAKAFVNAQGQLILTGIVAGTINDAPKTPDDSEFYVWGIDRGLLPGPGPFPRRPNIRFDAVVAVSVTPNGVSGTLQDLATGVTTPITSDQIQIGSGDIKDFIKVGLPASLLIPPGTTQRNAPTVNFFPTAALPLTSYTDVVSFTPEFRNFPISLVPIP